MLTTTKAIALHTVKYGERKVFATVFSREYGMATFVCPSGPQRGRVGRAGLFQPLNMLEVEFDMKPSVGIHTLRGVRLDRPAPGIAADPCKLTIAFFLAEFLRFALMNEQENRPLFDYIARSIEWLDTAEGDYANFHLIFMVRLSRFLGVFPDTGSFAPGAGFDLDSGTFSATPEIGDSVLRPSESALVPLLARLTFTSMRLLRLSRKERNECVETVLKYYRLHLPAFPELRSFAVLKELFA